MHRTPMTKSDRIVIRLKADAARPTAAGDRDVR
jgi:hypothetical protein